MWQINDRHRVTSSLPVYGPGAGFPYGGSASSSVYTHRPHAAHPARVETRMMRLGCGMVLDIAPGLRTGRGLKPTHRESW